MDMPSLLDLLTALTLFLVSCLIYRRLRCCRSKMPPGLFPFPIIGNIFQLTGKFHRTLANLSQTYGPVMSIKILNQTVIVISSPEHARELFKKYDHSFTKRRVLDLARALEHHKFSIMFLPAERQWRNLRKLWTEQILSTERLNASQGLRLQKVQQLCDYVNQCCINGEVVDIGAIAFTTSLNFLSNTIFSVDLAHFDSNASHEIKEIVEGVLENFGRLNLSDFFPVLQVIDPQGIRRQTKFYFEKLFAVFDEIISQRIKEKGPSGPSLAASSQRNDLLEVLLERCQQQGAEWSYNDMKHLILDLFIAGSDTPASAIEWTMAELLRNPEIYAKVAAEISEAIRQRKQIQESDMSMLPYLQAVVKETLRLHTIATLMGRVPKDDIQIDSYTVPKDADILINIWAINRDPNTWSNPDSFVPERFLDCESDLKGQHFEFLTFGAGRRICPGMSLAHRMVHLMVASLVHNFDWKLEDGIKPENVDMTEKAVFSARKTLPLKAIPTKKAI